MHFTVKQKNCISNKRRVQAVLRTLASVCVFLWVLKFSVAERLTCFFVCHLASKWRLCVRQGE